MARMTDKQYEFWTRLLLVIAVGSSIGFAKAGELSGWLGWLVGAIGIAAVVAGSVIHFRNMEQSDGESNSKQKSAPPLLGAGASLSKVSSGQEATADQLAFWHTQHAVETNFDRLLQIYRLQAAGTSHAVPRAYRHWLVHHDMVHDNWLHLESEKRLKEHQTETSFVDEVVEIVNRLSPECEFEFDQEHRLTIRPRSHAATVQPDVLFSLGIHKEHGPA